jgi:hypothetical protein
MMLLLLSIQLSIVLLSPYVLANHRVPPGHNLLTDFNVILHNVSNNVPILHW